MNETLDDFGAWSRAVSAVSNEFVALPDHFLEKIKILATIIKSRKMSLYELTKSVEGEIVCEMCLGGCCDTGKYHFTVTDLLVYLSDGKELFTPGFANKRCPYLGPNGCMMQPEYRPFNCITFHCERLERLLRHSDVREFYNIEKELRIQYAAMEEIFGNKFVYGLLSNYERDCVKKGKILFGQRPDSKLSGGWNGNHM